jgi:hypothetical protein
MDDLKENKIESTDIFSEHNVSQIKDRKYQNYYLNLTTLKTGHWRSFTSTPPLFKITLKKNLWKPFTKTTS